MIQKCTQCGAWCSAPYQKSPYALGRFIDGLFGTEGGAEFKCQCGNTWMELDRNKDQTVQYNAENPTEARQGKASLLHSKKK